MDAAAAFFESHATKWNFAAMKNFNRISPYVQNHLKKVYSTVAVALLASAVGVYAHLLWAVGGLLTSLGFVGCSLWLASSRSDENTKWNVLMLAAFCQGASLGGLIEGVLNFDPSIVVTAFLGSVAIFACFSAASVFARRREFLFLGGVLSSAVSALLTLQFGSMIFGGASFVYKLEIYGGLLLFIGYVLFDTQMVIEKAEHGDFDYVKHSLELFVDFVGIFFRLLIILTRNSAEKERKEERRRRR